MNRRMCYGLMVEGKIHRPCLSSSHRKPSAGFDLICRISYILEGSFRCETLVFVFHLRELSALESSGFFFTAQPGLGSDRGNNCGKRANIAAVVRYTNICDKGNLRAND